MKSRTQFITKAFSLMILATWTMAPTGASAADAADASAAAAMPAPQTQELDEVLVHAKRVIGLILDSEDKFIQIYNNLNTKNEFDVRCSGAPLTMGGMIMIRSCTPYFVTDFFESSYVEYAKFVPGEINCLDNGMVPFGTVTIYSSPPCMSSNVVWTRESVAPSPESMQALQVRQQAYQKNMLRVIYRDQRLLDLAQRLNGLREEVRSVQQQYYELFEAKRAAWARDPAKPSLGPRVL